MISMKMDNNNILPQERTELSFDRGSLLEDIDRTPLHFDHLSQKDFQLLTENQIDAMQETLMAVIEDVPFNSFYSINQLIGDLQESSDSNILDIFENLVVSSDKRDASKGLNCVGMCVEIQRRLAQIGVNSYICPALAGGLYNNEAQAYAKYLIR